MKNTQNPRSCLSKGDMGDTYHTWPKWSHLKKWVKLRNMGQNWQNGSYVAK